jgi:signal transduction histidine kinase/DNA-binding response OmpR family regulator
MPTIRPAACRRLHFSGTPGPRPAGRRLAWLALGVLAALLDSTGAVAAPPASEEPVGRPLIHNYSRRDFGGEVQQWDVVQDSRGVMYFANNAGVLEFDGRNWRLIELPSRLDVRALASDTAGSGRIYVGASGDFGYLGPDATGQLQFASLMPPEARHDRSFDQVFTPVVVPDGVVYFQARSKWCRLSGGQVRCRETDPTLSRIFVAGRKVYVLQQGVGLMEMVDDVLRPVSGGERFAHQDVRVVLPFAGQDGAILVGLRTSELFVQRGRSFEPFAPAVHDPRLDERLADGAVLPEGSFVFGTRLRGLLIVDRQGRLLQQIDRSAGLQDNYVHAVLPDQQGGLWLALQTGASRVEVASPFSVFDEASGLEQEWRAVVRHDESLYVRGYGGLFQAMLPLATNERPAAGRTLHFRRVPGIEAPVWSMLPMGDRLIVSSANGIDEIRAKRPRRLVSYPSMPMTMYRSRTDPRRVYVGLVEGLASLYLVGDSWRDEGRVAGIDETITSIAETKHGSLWLVSQRQRVIRVAFGANAEHAQARPNERKPRIRLYPAGGDTLTGRISIHEIAGRPVFLTDRRIVEFDEATERFVPAPGLTVLSEAGRRSFSYATEDRHGNIWVASRRPGGVDFLRKQPDGSYRVDNGGLRQVFVWSVYPEEHSDVVWLCTPDYLLRYDRSRRAHPSRAFTTLLRKVTADEDRLVYGGAPMPDADAASREASYHRPAFAYGTRSLQFDYAATAFDAPEMNEYQSRLEGFDREWSVWSRTPSRVYANLPPGGYRFVVRARDIHGQVSRDSVYQFTVLPAWYHSAWVYALYGLVGVGLVLLIRRFELKRSHVKLRRQLESVELEKLRELDALKSRFFADISHELRTPLTLILGPVRQILEESSKPHIVHKLQLVRRNTEYLLRLISQILDLSSLEARGMRLHAAAGDLAHCVRTSVASFAPAAEDQGIELRFDASQEAPSDRDAETHFDRDVVEKILNNLMGNALKFTPNGGAVSVSLVTGVDGSAAGREAGQGSYAQIVVSDTGIGIPRDRLPHIFDRFYQIEGTRSREGIGIGLALVKELVELHHGTLTVDSVEGRGTTFVIRLPTGTAHLEPEEIVSALPVKTIEAPEAIPPGALDRAEPASLTADLASESDEDTAVLIVEDHTGVRLFVREQLQRYYRVLEAENGSKGFDVAVSSLPDLVLSDVMMPGLNGYELCRALKHDKRTCHIPVVLLTARAGRDDKLLGLDTGADSYLVKPFDASELLLQVRNLIEQRRLLRERFSAPIILKPSEMGVTPMDEAFLQKVVTVVQTNLADPDFDVVMLGREVGLSRSQLHRKLRALTNRSPTLLIRSIRLQRAAELLRHKGGSVAEIAYCVGFSSQTYFAKCFREELGCSPKEYARGVSSTSSASAPMAQAR